MPQYKVKQGQKGFYEGRLYDAAGKRPILVVDKPLKPVPSWVIPLKDESKTAAQQAAADKQVSNASEVLAKAKQAQKKALNEKTKVDESAKVKIEAPGEIDTSAEIDAVTFVGKPGSTVETL